MRISVASWFAAVCVYGFLAPHAVDARETSSDPQIYGPRNADARSMIAADAATIPTRPKPCVIRNKVLAVGTIEPAEVAVLTSPWVSIMKRVHVSVGDHVSKGQLLISGDSTDLVQGFDTLDSQRRIAVSGQHILEVEKSQVTARRDRLGALASKGIVAASEITKLDQRIGQIDAKIAEKSRQIALLEKFLVDLQLQLAKVDYYAPIDGTITELLADSKSVVGTTIATDNTVLAKITRPGRYLVRFSVLDIQVGKLAVGEPAVITFPSGETAKGTISLISPLARRVKITNSAPQLFGSPSQASDASGLFEVTATFDRAGQLLPEGLSARIAAGFSARETESCLPWGAIETDGSLAKVRIYTDSKGWTSLPVQLGARDESMVELLTPLDDQAVVMSHLW